MLSKPFPQSFWVNEELFCAGCYPGAISPAERDDKLNGLLNCRIRRVINLMEPDEKSYGGLPFQPYEPRLHELAEERGVSIDCLRLPIEDASVPTHETMEGILNLIDQSLEDKLPTYLHCWGGHGRTGTVVSCYLIRHGSSPRQAIDTVIQLRATLPRNHHPFEGGQETFVLSWSG